MNQDEIRCALRPFKGIREDYKYNADIMCTDDERVRRVKYIVENLDPADRTIIRLYAELGSLTKLAALLHISRSSVHNEIQRIRKTILERYDDSNNTNSVDPRVRLDH